MISLLERARRLFYGQESVLDVSKRNAGKVPLDLVVRDSNGIEYFTGEMENGSDGEPVVLFYSKSADGEIKEVPIKDLDKYAVIGHS